MARAAFPLSIVALGMLLFLAWMHPAVLRSTNIGWLLTGDDRGQSAIGLAAYLRAGDGWLHEPLLAAPEGMALLFTDSIPLMGLLLGPIARWLPPAQFVGAWYLLCCVLQAGFAAALVRRYAPDRLTAWLGTALLAAMPVFFNRYGHASLCAQWLLLWALWIFVEPRRAERPLWWAAVLSAAALIHAYLLLMVAAIGASALLVGMWHGPHRGRTVVGALAALSPALLLLAGHGAFGGPYASTGTYGQFPAALDAWWNPANPGYTALLLSSPALPEGRGFEGFNYLGAGLVLLVIVSVVRDARGAMGDRQRELLRRLAWLLPAFAVLTLLAIGPAPVWRGHPLWTATLPATLVDALDPVRAGGRLLWPVTYTLALAAIASAMSMGRATLMLGAALALQVIDLTPMLSAIRATSARAADPRSFSRTLDPRWTSLVGGASAVQFEPAEPFRDLALMEEIGWRAVTACRPLRYFYASREAQATRVRIDADSRAFRAGRLDPTRLYVLFGTDPAPPGIAARVRTLDSIRIIPPSRRAPPSACG